MNMKIKIRVRHALYRKSVNIVPGINWGRYDGTMESWKRIVAQKRKHRYKSV